MKILLVCNNAYINGNGLSTAIQELQKRLAAAGQEVRIISVKNPKESGVQPYYKLEQFIFPILQPIIEANGFCYAKIDRKLLTEAIAWADVVHMEDAFPLEVVACKIAKKLGKPCVASYHLFAENIMANLGMGIKNPLNPIVTWFWKVLVYNHCSDIHCPSATVRDYLARFRFKSRMHVFSNGMDLEDKPFVPSTPETNPYLILCIGRLAREKSQKTLLEAMRYSRHAGEIQLAFAGNGPLKNKYIKIADKLCQEGILKHRPEFGFYTHEQLSEMARKAYLYIHCAWVEVEGLSCLDAIKEGCVPIIAEGPCVAASQFALDRRSIFPVKDSKALAERIDWWIEHPEERKAMSPLYAVSAKKYSSEISIKEMISMYEQALGK